MNPIWKREFFARWRDWRSHLLLFALAVLLGTAAYWSYSDAIFSPPVNYNVYPPQPLIESVATRASRAGHALFSTLAVGNVAVWFVLAPLLTATGVARERERGLLESLQLTRMLPRSQIGARASSALLYLLALQLVTLPVYFVAFSFGGVSEGEIGRAWAIVALTGFCGVGLGLMLSAQSARPSGALFGAVAVLVLWSVASFVGGNGSVWWWYFGVGKWSNSISEALFYGHPIALVWRLCDANSFSTPGFVRGWSRVGLDEAFPWSLAAWFVMGTFGLLKATKDVTRAFPPASWAGRNTLISRWKTRREARIQEQQKRSKVSVEGALLADLPFDRLIRFKNPLLNREVKSRFRVRRASAWVWMGRILVFLAGACAWTMVIFSVFFDPPGRTGCVPVVLWMEWLLGLALVGTFAAASFAREREAGTWEGLQLSLLSPTEIARTKWASPLVAFACLTCPLWLMLFALLPLGKWSGVPFRWVFLGAGVVVASLAFVSALGNWISLRSKSSAHATCWTLGAMLALFVGVPLLVNSLDVPDRLSSWRYGMTNETAYTFTSENYEAPQYLALYERETGRHVNPPVYRSTHTPTFGEQEEWSRYYNWFQERVQAVRRFQKMLGAYDPIDVLVVLQDRGAPSGYGYNRAVVLDDASVVTIALLHILLATCGTLGLLLLVRTRLTRTREV